MWFQQQKQQQQQCYHQYIHKLNHQSNDVSLESLLFVDKERFNFHELPVCVCEKHRPLREYTRCAHSQFLKLSLVVSSLMRVLYLSFCLCLPTSTHSSFCSLSICVRALSLILGWAIQYKAIPNINSFGFIKQHRFAVVTTSSRRSIVTAISLEVYSVLSLR